MDKKRQIYDFYRKAFSDIDDISMMPVHDDIANSNCWLSCMTLKKDSQVTPLGIQLALEENNLEARPIWKPMHMQPVFASYDYIDYHNVAKYLFDTGICLPSDTKMEEKDLARVVNIIKRLWK